MVLCIVARGMIVTRGGGSLTWFGREHDRSADDPAAAVSSKTLTLPFYNTQLINETQWANGATQQQQKWSGHSLMRIYPPSQSCDFHQWFFDKAPQRNAANKIRSYWVAAIQIGRMHWSYDTPINWLYESVQLKWFNKELSEVLIWAGLVICVNNDMMLPPTSSLHSRMTRRFLIGSDGLQN